MKLSDKIAHWHFSHSHPFYTFEFFPPRTDQGFENLLRRIARLKALHPIALTVTWSAGGSSKDRSLDLAGFSQAEQNVDTILHVTCTNMEPGLIDSVLRNAKDRGIQNILALRGDPPYGAEHWLPTDPRFTHAVDLVRYIKSSAEFGDHFCVGVAAYPDVHTDAVSAESDLQYLKEKVDAGADFIVTQLFFDVDAFFGWEQKVRDIGIRIPIIPGVAPIQSYASFVRLVKLCNTKVPDYIHQALDPIHNDDQKVKDYGVRLAMDICSRLTKGGRIKGVHFCTLNLEKSVTRVLEGLRWGHQAPRSPNRIIIETSADPDAHLPPDALISASEASHMIERPTTPEIPPTPIQIEEPSGAADSGTEENKTLSETNFSTWDDFHNGRFGDPNSPAWGGLDSWVVSGLGIAAPEAISRWGYPKTVPDVQSIFLSHLTSSDATSSTPFSHDPLSAESGLIVNHLKRLVDKDWWTVASQPAVDATESSDPVVGWGPKGGYVFQKAFVECFCNKSCVDWLEARVKKEESGGKGKYEFVSYYAANMKGDLVTNVIDGTRMAVTWGVFPGQEIAQPTIIERESFLAWKADVFSMWSEWASFYPPNSESRVLLEKIRDERWLVSVVHHDFKDPDALWNFLLDPEDSC